MKINSISNTNFKSNVKFIEDFNKTPEDRLGTYNSAAVHEALTQLEENGKNDTVKVFIIDGRLCHSLLIEMFTDEGIGTMFYKD